MTNFFPTILSIFLFLAPGLVVSAGPLLDPDPSGIPAKSDQDRFRVTLRDAQKGDAKAMGLLGLMYEKGVGCQADKAAAFKWLKRGSKKGDVAAQNNLGFLYLKGLGVKEDDAEALKWFQKAADQGLASAQSNCGLIYGRGLGVKKDYAQALAWFRKAAGQNDPDAQVNLAQMLSLGEGVPRDYVESHMWFSLALRHHRLGDNQVADLRNDVEWLEKRMTGREIDEARERARDWKPSPGVAELPKEEDLSPVLPSPGE